MSPQATHGSSIQIADFLLQAPELGTDGGFAIYDAVVLRDSSYREHKKRPEIFKKRFAMSHEEAVQFIWAVSSSYRQRSSSL